MINNKVSAMENINTDQIINITPSEETDAATNIIYESKDSAINIKTELKQESREEIKFNIFADVRQDNIDYNEDYDELKTEVKQEELIDSSSTRKLSECT